MDTERLRSLEYRARNAARRRGFEVMRVAGGTRAESLLALHLDKLFAHLDIDTVLDVGARIGDYGLWLRHNGFRGRIISFEPVQASFQVLQERADADPNWQAVNVALGAEDGTAEINVAHQTFFSSFLEPNTYAFDEFEGGVGIDRTEVVTVRRLDGLLPELQPEVRARSARPSIYLKMDTQGWDLEVLRGARDVLERIAALQSEVSVKPIYSSMPSFEESLAEIGALGFELSGLFPVNLDSRMRVVEFDCVCISDRVEPA